MCACNNVLFCVQEIRGNQTKYSPSPRHAPPPRPTSYQASFKKSNGQDSKVTIQKVDGKYFVLFWTIFVSYDYTELSLFNFQHQLLFYFRA